MKVSFSKHSVKDALVVELDLAIVVPCYNEAKRFQRKSYERFLHNYKNVILCFVNDGSNDGTEEVLRTIQELYPRQVRIISQAQNSGKAEAVRVGVLKCHLEYRVEKIAYLDADLSTSLEECFSICQALSLSSSSVFAFGSRIAKLDSTICRKKHRFLIGRLIATIISVQLGLKIYDTQCGCKVFNSALAEPLFGEKFISRWLFDVEIFHRLIHLYGRNELRRRAKEIPLRSWYDTDGSKVSFTYIFKLFLDLRNIYKTYAIPNKRLKPFRHETAFN